MKSNKVTSPTRNKNINTNVNKPNEYHIGNINQNDIYVTVCIKSETYRIFCGEGKQKIRWLVDVAIHHFDKNFGLHSGNIYK